MRFGKSSLYALFAVLYVAKNANGQPVQGREIAHAYGIPEEYLLKILQTLTRRGILQSARGRFGGFLLGKQAKEISLSDVFSTLEPPRSIHQLLERTIPDHHEVKSFLETLIDYSVQSEKNSLARVPISQLVNLDSS